MGECQERHSVEMAAAVAEERQELAGTVMDVAVVASQAPGRRSVLHLLGQRFPVFGHRRRSRRRLNSARSEWHGAKLRLAEMRETVAHFKLAHKSALLVGHAKRPPA